MTTRLLDSQYLRRVLTLSAEGLTYDDGERRLGEFFRAVADRLNQVYPDGMLMLNMSLIYVMSLHF